MLHAKIQRSAFHAVESINNSENVTQVIEILSSTGRSFGYDSFLIAGFPLLTESTDPYIMASGWPEEWAERYLLEKHIKYDPVVKHLKLTNKPFLWSDAPVKSGDHRAKRVMDEAAGFGLNDGLAVPIYATQGLQGIVTFGAEKLELNQTEKAALHLIALYAHQAISSFQPDAEKTDQFRAIKKQLSQRETECLKWMSLGKTAYDIGIITGLSDRTVEHYIASCMRKLNVTNRVQAVAEGLRHGLIS